MTHPEWEWQPRIPTRDVKHIAGRPEDGIEERAKLPGRERENGEVTVSDLMDYLQQFESDTIVVLLSEDTVEHDGAISLEIALTEIEEAKR